MSTINTIQVIFNLPIGPELIPKFKREVLHLQDPKNDIWHNHVVHDEYSESLDNMSNIQGKNYRRYPLIQFRSERYAEINYACIWAVNEGVDELMNFILSGRYKAFSWNGRTYPISILDIKESTGTINVSMDTYNFHSYSLTHFLPFNEDRYREFKDAYRFIDKLSLIEQMIQQNIGLFAEEFDLNLSREDIKVETLDIKGFKTARYKLKAQDRSLPFVSVDMMVGINAVIPSGLSIGNLKSLGYGILRPYTRKKDVQKVL